MSTSDAAQDDQQPIVSFDYLAKNRRLLQEFCRLQVASLTPFACADLAIFSLTLEDRPTKFRHLTSSSTCFASLDFCPDIQEDGSKPNFHDLGDKFAKIAIDEPLEKTWRSDEKAEIYCSCRGLPYVLSRLDGWHPRIEEHLYRISYQLQDFPDVARRFAIGEAAPAIKRKDKKDEKRGWYPPNAYHTYWTLEILSLLRDKRFIDGRAKSREFAKLSKFESQMRLWARQQLGLQVALHSGHSSKLDTDQLAWSLAIIVSEPSKYESDLVEQDFIRQSLKWLFDTQQRIGTWRHYDPLFHYPRVGNAYCYVFETFAVLLEQALKPKADFLRLALRDYAPRLLRLWQYADATKAAISESKRWDSGKIIWLEFRSQNPN